MKITATLLFIFCLNLAFGQDFPSSNKSWAIEDSKLTKFSAKWEGKNKLMHGWIINKHGFKQYGILYEVTDSTINLAHPRNLRQTPVQVYSPGISEVKTLLLREDKRKGKYVLIGVPIGAVIGLGIMTMITPSISTGGFGQPEEFELITMGGIGGGLLGFVGGMFVGSKTFRLRINGSKENFEKSRKRLKKLAMMD